MYDPFDVKELTKYERKNIYKANKKREITLSEFDYCDSGEWIEFPYTLSGDYIGGTVEKANFNCLKEMFKGIPNILFAYGDYSSSVILMKLSTYIHYKKVQEIKESLESYPCINDDEVYKIEHEIELESWDNWVKIDLISSLESKGIAIPESEDELREKFYEVSDSISEYFIFESVNGCYIDIDKIVANWI